ncbi:hypothetical protein [Bartonella sp. CB189]
MAEDVNLFSDQGSVVCFHFFVVFPQDNNFFDEIYPILKKTLGILREHH